MSRPILNADEHLKALGKKSQACIALVVQYIRATHPSRVHLYSSDIERISAELRSSGFDLGRGFKVCGVKVIATD